MNWPITLHEGELTLRPLRIEIESHGWNCVLAIALG